MFCMVTWVRVTLCKIVLSVTGYFSFSSEKMAEDDPIRDSRFTAEISNRMRVPDRIMVAGENQTRSPTFVGINGPSGMNYGRDSTQKIGIVKL